MAGFQHDTAYGQYLRSHGPRGFDWRYAAPVAGIAAMPAVAAVGGGSAAGSATLPAVATEGIGFSSAGGGMTLGSLLGSRGFEAAMNAGTSLFGMRAQNRANRYAADANSRLMAEQIAMERERLRVQQEADAADRADAERRWAAEQAFAAKQFDAGEEERAYNRSLVEAREARRAAFRPYSERAMRTLGSILGI